MKGRPEIENLVKQKKARTKHFVLHTEHERKIQIIPGRNRCAKVIRSTECSECTKKMLKQQRRYTKLSLLTKAPPAFL